MEKQAFTIYYNGKNVAVTGLEANTFLAQITYKPIYIKLIQDNEGKESWIDTEMGQETALSKEIGHLIANHLSYSQHMY